MSNVPFTPNTYRSRTSKTCFWKKLYERLVGGQGRRESHGLTYSLSCATSNALNGRENWLEWAPFRNSCSHAPSAAVSVSSPAGQLVKFDNITEHGSAFR